MLNRPPKPLEVLIYGNSSSPGMAAVSTADFRSTLTTVGHHVTTCENQTSCAKALGDRHFDVVLADPTDAGTAKADAKSTAVVPIVFRASKESLERAKAEFGQAFDASKGSLRLLSVLNSAARSAR